jgi:hypothetical protein
MVSRCCFTDVLLVNTETDYYECHGCGCPCDLTAFVVTQATQPTGTEALH